MFSSTAIIVVSVLLVCRLAHGRLQPPLYPNGMDPFIPAAFHPVVEELWEILVDSNPDQTLEKDNLAGAFIRHAWHSAGTWDEEKQLYGSNGGEIRFDSVVNHPSNSGLDRVLHKIDHLVEKFEGLTYADLYMLAGNVAISFVEGPRIHFCGGRRDEPLPRPGIPDDFPEGLLPAAAMEGDDLENMSLQKITDHVIEIFDRMGFDAGETVALLAAHSVGRMHTNNSGFEGTWDTTEFIMDNMYFTVLADDATLGGWECVDTSREKQYQLLAGASLPLDCSQPMNPANRFNMNPADIALSVQPEFQEFVQLYANDQDQMHRDFARAWHKLIMFGVTCDHNIKINDITLEKALLPEVQCDAFDFPCSLGYQDISLIATIFGAVIVVGFPVFCFLKRATITKAFNGCLTGC